MNKDNSITIGGPGEPVQDGFWDDPLPGNQETLWTPRCHETHPPIQVGTGTLLGGNCRDHKRHKGVDLYVALDGSMAHPHFDAAKPMPQCVHYPITNMSVPNNPDKFHQLVITIRSYLAKGKTVHVGCIGGHGRTGLVLAAVIAVDYEKVGPDCDAIGWLRANYCKKAVESNAQEGFLATHYGCKLPPKKPRVDKRRRGR